MADWDSAHTVDLDSLAESNNEHIYSNGQHSRQSSRSSGMSSSNKENQNLDRGSSLASEGTDDSSEKELILVRGHELHEESRTESAVYLNAAMVQSSGMSTLAPARPPKPEGGQVSWSGGTAKERAAKSPYAPSPIEPIPEEDITIPNDANISAFTANQLASFLKCLKVDDRIISHLYRKSVDGKRFSKLRDSELDNLNMNNPVIVFFRDKSNVKPAKKKGPFML